MQSRNTREGRYAGYHRGHIRSNNFSLRWRNGFRYIAIIHPSIEYELRTWGDTAFFDEDGIEVTPSAELVAKIAKAEYGTMQAFRYHST